MIPKRIYNINLHVIESNDEIILLGMNFICLTNTNISIGTKIIEIDGYKLKLFEYTTERNFNNKIPTTLK